MRPKPFERVCSVCKLKKNKFELIRLVKNEGKIEFDKNFNLSGKGAYICKECALELKKNKALNKAFRCNVASGVYDEIANRLKEI